MYGVLHRQEQRSGVDHQERLTYSLDVMAGHERGTALSLYYQYWTSRCDRKHRLPILHNFRPKDDLPSEVAQQVSWIDVTLSDPLNYSLHDHPAGICGDWNHRRIHEHASKLHSKACAMEYFFCRNTRAPVYMHIEQKMRGVEREYSRLLLPLINKSGKVVRLAYAWRFLRDPMSAESLASRM